MKTLLDVQNEIRDLGQLLGDTARRLDTLSAEVHDLRTANAGADTNRYDDIRVLAKSVPFKTHPLAEAEDPGGSLRRLYLTALASAVRLCGEDVSLPLAYVQWVLDRSGLGMTLEEVWTESAKPGRVDYDAVRESIRDDLRLCLIVDMLVIAQTGAEDGEPSPAALEYAASLCGVLGVSGEDAKHCAAAVRVMIASLKDINRDAIISASESWWLAFYLGESSISFLNNRCRVIACRVLPLSYQTFSWRHPNQCSYVKEGEIFASLKDNPNLTGKRKPGTKDFTASCNGWLYHFELNQVQYGVISYQNDNMNSIRAWVQKEVYK